MLLVFQNLGIELHAQKSRKSYVKCADMNCPPPSELPHTGSEFWRNHVFPIVEIEFPVLRFEPSQASSSVLCKNSILFGHLVDLFMQDIITEDKRRHSLT